MSTDQPAATAPRGPALAASGGGTRAGVWLAGAAVLAFLLLWQVVAVLAASNSLPAPTTVFGRMVEEIASGVLPHHLGITLLRVVVSFAAAISSLPSSATSCGARCSSISRRSSW